MVNFPPDLSGIKDYLDMVMPSVIRFNTDHYIFGSTFRCVWALREYPTATDEQAILSHLGEMDGVTLRIYTRQVSLGEERQIIHNASNRSRMQRANANDIRQAVIAEQNQQDVADLVAGMHKSKVPLLHCAVYIELIAPDMDRLRVLQTEVLTELVRAKLNVDRLLLRQQEGFLSVMPAGRNVFGSRFERVLPASSVANLFPFSFSGKTDPHGLYLGRDKFGSNIFVDFDQRDNDKTNGNILILGNSGQGKSHLLKHILCNELESGKRILLLDPEAEYRELTEALGGCYLDLMSGQYLINLLEPKPWAEEADTADADAPAAFRQSSRISQHISFLRDVFRVYKHFSEPVIDTIEIMVSRLYDQWGLSDSTDFDALGPEGYPILSDLYALMEEEYRTYDEEARHIYTADLLREALLGLHSMCVGAESKFFNGRTNIASDRIVTFGVKGLLEASRNIKDALLFNVLSYMSGVLLSVGGTVAGIDELYLFLTNLTAIDYIRSFMKRARKKESALILSSQNLEDFDLESVREYTKPLFAIPSHVFLFNGGNVSRQFYKENLQLEDAEYDLIREPQRGVCLYKCGNERYDLQVITPGHKAILFGKAGGR